MVIYLRLGSWFSFITSLCNLIYFISNSCLDILYYYIIFLLCFCINLYKFYYSHLALNFPSYNCSHHLVFIILIHIISFRIHILLFSYHLYKQIPYYLLKIINFNFNLITFNYLIASSNC